MVLFSAVIHISLEPYCLLSFVFTGSDFFSNFLLSADGWPWSMAFGLGFHYSLMCVHSVIPSAIAEM